MKAIPQVSLHFPWLQLDRQVIVGGRAERLSTVDVMKYFLSRPKGSQLAAWASKQSSRINSRQALETQFAQVKEKFSKGEIPLPDFWGGYRWCLKRLSFGRGVSSVCTIALAMGWMMVIGKSPVYRPNSRISISI